MTPQFSYEVLKTDDGSPTVRLWKPEQPAECMHHTGGALTESIYIYLEALRVAHEAGLPLRVLSVGTGLGYNEMLAASFGLLHKISPENLKITTFESEDFIRGEFTNWLNNIPGPWHNIYSEVAESVASKFNLDTDAIRNYLSLAEIRPALSANTQFTCNYTVIFFDSFSSKATPELWSETWLKDFLIKACAPQCVLSTYAAKGTLTRALKNAGFSVQKRPGFQGKRDSTLATRH